MEADDPLLCKYILRAVGIGPCFNPGQAAVFKDAAVGVLVPADKHQSEVAFKTVQQVARDQRTAVGQPAELVQYDAETV